jgi:putative copper resistance protein D
MSPSLLVTRWTVAVVPDLAAAFGAGAYVAAAARVPGWPRRRTLAFLAGLAWILVALQSGVAAADDQLLSAHMAQHMLLLMVAPPLILAGQPLLLALRALPRGLRPRPARALRRASGWVPPLAGLALFYAVVASTHLATFYDAALRHPAVHEVEHALYLVAGLIVWWPLVGADPAVSRRLGGLGRLGYVLAVMPAMAVLGAYLNRAPSLVYPAYGPPAHALGISALDDQAQAGAIMWVIGGVIMTVAGLWAAVAALLDEERRQQSRDQRAAIAAPLEPERRRQARGRQGAVNA